MKTHEPSNPELLIDQEFQDVESLNNTFGWDLDWRQIEPGSLYFRMTAFGHTGITVMRVDFNRGFHQIGITPKVYMKVRRLAAVQSELIKQSPGVTVRDIAGRWGFWHMGSFAAEYKKHFGELPSETLFRHNSPDKIE